MQWKHDLRVGDVYEHINGGSHRLIESIEGGYIVWSDEYGASRCLRGVFIRRIGKLISRAEAPPEKPTAPAAPPAPSSTEKPPRPVAEPDDEDHQPVTPEESIMIRCEELLGYCKGFRSLFQKQGYKVAHALGPNAWAQVTWNLTELEASATLLKVHLLRLKRRASGSEKEVEPD